MARKALTTFGLALLLLQWGAPIVCMPRSAAMGSCHEANAPNMAIMNGVQKHAPCAEVGMCAAQVTAVAGLMPPGIPIPLSHDALTSSASSLVPSDPSTPPAPPPQA